MLVWEHHGVTVVAGVLHRPHLSPARRAFAHVDDFGGIGGILAAGVPAARQQNPAVVVRRGQRQHHRRPFFPLGHPGQPQGAPIAGLKVQQGGRETAEIEREDVVGVVGAGVEDLAGWGQVQAWIERQPFHRAGIAAPAAADVVPLRATLDDPGKVLREACEGQHRVVGQLDQRRIPAAVAHIRPPPPALGHRVEQVGLIQAAEGRKGQAAKQRIVVLVGSPRHQQLAVGQQGMTRTEQIAAQGLFDQGD